MPKVVASQLRLRRAFRYGYFAFLLAFLACLILIAVATFYGVLGDIVDWLVAGGSTSLAIGLGVGLSVPLFFAFWSLVGSAILRGRVNRPLLEGLRD